jgi:uncharacterized protein (TIGR03086 family)
VSDVTDRYRSALEGVDAVIRRVPAEGWDRPSPCEGWSALDVAAHLIGGVRMVSLLASGGSPSRERPPTREVVGDDPVASWESARDSALAALTPETLAAVVPGPVGEMPLGALLERFMTGEILVHTWDLARAAGLDVELDPQLVEETYARWEPMDGPMMRQPGVFGPRQTAPEGASRQEQLMAFLGRRV